MSPTTGRDLPEMEIEKGGNGGRDHSHCWEKDKERWSIEIRVPLRPELNNAKPQTSQLHSTPDMEASKHSSNSNILESSWLSM